MDWSEYIYRRTRVLREKSDYVKPKDTFWVSDLYSCRKKVNFRRENKIEVAFSDDFSAKSRAIGILIHKGLQEYLKEDDYEIEKKIVKEIDDYKIVGKVDAINDEEVLEIKYQKSFKGANKHHILQLSTYLNMTGLKHGTIIYITPFKFTDVSVDSVIDDDYIRFLINNDFSPFGDWECSYCEYNGICDMKVKKKR